MITRVDLNLDDIVFSGIVYLYAHLGSQKKPMITTFSDRYNGVGYVDRIIDDMAELMGREVYSRVDTIGVSGFKEMPSGDCSNLVSGLAKKFDYVEVIKINEVKNGND